MRTHLIASDDDLIARYREALREWEVTAVGATSSITGGGAVRELEERFVEHLDGRSALAMGSGTAALVACLIAVGVEPGRDVITSVLDWPAASEAIRLVGARVVFADVDPRTLTIDPRSIEATRTSNTAAVVATHLLGIPADVPAIKAAAGDSVAVIEDCAQAWGATLDGRVVGTLGDCAAFSLGPGKDIDAGEGGVATFQREADWDRAVVATQHRVRALATTRPTVTLHMSSRIHPLAAILALHAMSTAPARLGRRRDEVAAWMTVHPSVDPLGHDRRREPSWWRVPVRGGSDDCTASPLGVTLLSSEPAEHFPHAAAAALSTRLVEVSGNGCPSQHHH